MNKVKRDNLELTKKGIATFNETVEKVEKAYKEWREFYEKYKESLNEKK